MRRRRQRRSELECFVVYMILTHSGVTRTRRTLPPASWTSLGRPRVKYTPRVSFRFDIEDRRDVENVESTRRYLTTSGPVHYIKDIVLKKKKDVCLHLSIAVSPSKRVRPLQKEKGKPNKTGQANLRKVEISRTGPTRLQILFVAVQHRSIHTTPSGGIIHQRKIYIYIYIYNPLFLFFLFAFSISIRPVRPVLFLG